MSSNSLIKSTTFFFESFVSVDAIKNMANCFLSYSGRSSSFSKNSLYIAVSMLFGSPYAIRVVIFSSESKRAIFEVVGVKVGSVFVDFFFC